MHRGARSVRIAAVAVFVAGFAVAGPAQPAARAAAGCTTTVAGGTLTDVAATSPSNAWAVGYYPAVPGTLLQTDQTLIEHWNGRAWCTVASPDPAGSAGENQLLAVTVTSASNAWAIGYYDNIKAGGTQKTLIEHWDGQSWKQVPSPNPAAPGMGNQLNDVAATSATDAWAVGSYVNASHLARALLLHWDGTAWRALPFPNHSTSTELLSVFAGSATNVWLAGDYSSIATGQIAQTLIAHKNGGSWTVTPSPDPAGPSTANYLQSLAVPSSSAGLAVGTYFNSTSNLTFSAWGNGTSWTTIATPNPGGTGSAVNGLDDVTARGIDAWAVGYYRQGGFNGTFQTLIVHWTGASWNLVPSPDVPGLHNILYGVAATSSFNAWAVGGLVNTGSGLNQQTLILHWNGLVWTLTPSP